MKNYIDGWRHFIDEATKVDSGQVRKLLEPTMQDMLTSDDFKLFSGEEKEEMGRQALDSLSIQLTNFINNKLANKEKSPTQKLDLSEEVFNSLRTINELSSEQDPTYIQHIYNVVLRVAIHKTKGGDREQTFTEIRGIPGVTVVSVDSRGTGRDDTFYYSTLNVKFEIVGRGSPQAYVQKILLPNIRNVKGLRLLKTGRVNPVT